jgi:hypothetical protein
LIKKNVSPRVLFHTIEEPYGKGFCGELRKGNKLLEIILIFMKQC